MDFDPFVTLAGLLVGFVVGLTGMGGGALMTPVLVLLFNVQPMAAISSDLVASAVMKPVGSAVHLRRGTPHWGLVRWLAVGSVPAAFAGVLILRALGDSDDVRHQIKVVLGAMLLVAAASMVAKSVLGSRRAALGPDAPVRVRPALTVAAGAVGGVVVGMTSVGSGSLIIVMLMVIYPSLAGARLVGTDLVQAVPLVVAASIGHLVFGGVELGLTGSLLLGSLPGVYLGARISAGASAGRVIRPALIIVIMLSGLKLVGVPTSWLGGALAAGVTLALAAVARRPRGGAKATGPPLDPEGKARTEVGPRSFTGTLRSPEEPLRAGARPE